MANAARWQPPAYDMNDPEDRLVAEEQQTGERYFDLQGRITQHFANVDWMGNPSDELMTDATTARKTWEQAKRVCGAHCELIRAGKA